MRANNRAKILDDRQEGLSLIELMIALTLGMILLVSLTRLTLDTRQSGLTLTERGEELEQGRYAIEMLKNDLKLAGFYGLLYRPPLPPDSLPDPCSLILDNLAHALPLMVQGQDQPATATSCTSGAIPGVDRLIIRRAGTEGFMLDAGADDDDGDGDKDDLDYGRAYLQAYEDRFILGYCSKQGQCTGVTNCLNAVCERKIPAVTTRAITGDEITVFGMKYRNATLSVPVHPYFVHIYFIRGWSNRTDDNIPTLMRTELVDYGSTPRLVANPILDGVENMAFQYGVDNSEPPDDKVDYYTPNPASTLEWSRVRAVKINIMVRSLNKAREPVGTPIYDMGDGAPVKLSAAAMQYRHHVLSTQANLENTLGRNIE